MQENNLTKKQILKQAIRATCSLKGQKLFYFILQQLQDLQIDLEDIKGLSVDQKDQYLVKFPLQIFIPSAPAHPLQPIHIKKLFIGALMYPLENLHPKADFCYIQSYVNVPTQQVISAELGYPSAIDDLESLMTMIDLGQSTQNHKFIKIQQGYSDTISETVYERYIISREKQPQLFTDDQKIFDFHTQALQFLDYLLNVYQKFHQPCLCLTF